MEMFMYLLDCNEFNPVKVLLPFWGGGMAIALQRVANSWHKVIVKVRVGAMLFHRCNDRRDGGPERGHRDKSP